MKREKRESCCIPYESNTPLNIIFAGNFGGLNGTHLRDPVGSWLNLADGSDLVTSVSWDTYIVLTLKRELNIPNLQHVGTALFGVLAGRLQDLVDKGICNVED